MERGLLINPTVPLLERISGSNHSSSLASSDDITEKERRGECRVVMLLEQLRVPAWRRMNLPMGCLYYLWTFWCGQFWLVGDRGIVLIYYYYYYYLDFSFQYSKEPNQAQPCQSSGFPSS